jgi:preprotein translocase subunit SecE
MEQRPGIDPKRLVAIFFFFAAIVLGIFLEKILAIAFSYTRWPDVEIFGADWTLSTVLGYGIAAAAAVATWRAPRIHGVATQAAQELEKVTWPTWRESRASTVAVLIFTFVAAAILGIFDVLWARISSLIY